MTELYSLPEGVTLPLRIRILGAAVGISAAGYGMASFLSGGGMSQVIIPIFLGAFIVYFSGYSKKLFFSSEGLCRDKIFWGQAKREIIPWQDIADIKVILNKGRNIYVIPNSLKGSWPFTFSRESEEEVIAFLKKHIDASDIHIDR